MNLVNAVCRMNVETKRLKKRKELQLNLLDRMRVLHIYDDSLVFFRGTRHKGRYARNNLCATLI